MDFRLIKTLCKHIQSTESIEECLETLVDNYNKFKTRFSAKQRTVHRREFGEAFERCEYSIVTTEKISNLLKSLMDHAFKLPEGISFI